MRGGSSLALVSGVSTPDSSEPRGNPSASPCTIAFWLKHFLCPITDLRQESHRLITQVRAKAPAYALAPTIAGRRFKEFLKGFPCLTDKLFVDMIWGPTTYSSHHPYAPMGCTTYAHIDPAKAALHAGSYQDKIREKIKVDNI